MSNEAKTLIERARALAPEDRIALIEDALDGLDRADARYRSAVRSRDRRPTVTAAYRADGEPAGSKT